MEINFGRNGNFDVSKYGNGADGVQASRPGDCAAAGKNAVSLDFGGMTVTRTQVSAEDLEAAGIPEAALSRNDALGNLIGMVFNLPPPPMPAFQA